MSKLDIKLVEGEDWEVLTIDGELVYDGHGMSTEEVLSVLKPYLETSGINIYAEYIDDHEEYSKEVRQYGSRA